MCSACLRTGLGFASSTSKGVGRTARGLRASLLRVRTRELGGAHLGAFAPGALLKLVCATVRRAPPAPARTARRDRRGPHRTPRAAAPCGSAPFAGAPERAGGGRHVPLVVEPRAQRLAEAVLRSRRAGGERRELSGELVQERPVRMHDQLREPVIGGSEPLARENAQRDQPQGCRRAAQAAARVAARDHRAEHRGAVADRALELGRPAGCPSVRHERAGDPVIGARHKRAERQVARHRLLGVVQPHEDRQLAGQLQPASRALASTAAGSAGGTCDSSATRARRRRAASPAAAERSST